MKNAAYHEAGHAVMLKLLGGSGTPVIWKNLDCGDTSKEFVGTCLMHAQPTNSKKNWQVLVGAAGVVAENILANRTYDLVCVFDYAYGGDISESDLKLIEGYTISDIDECTSLLMKHWQEVEVQAEVLIKSI